MPHPSLVTSSGVARSLLERSVGSDERIDYDIDSNPAVINLTLVLENHADGSGD